MEFIEICDIIVEKAKKENYIIEKSICKLSKEIKTI